MLKEVWKTIVRWAYLPVISFQYARGYGCSVRKSIAFAWTTSAGCQGWIK